MLQEAVYKAQVMGQVESCVPKRESIASWILDCRPSRTGHVNVNWIWWLKRMLHSILFISSESCKYLCVNNVYMISVTVIWLFILIVLLVIIPGILACKLFNILYTSILIRKLKRNIEITGTWAMDTPTPSLSIENKMKNQCQLTLFLVFVMRMKLYWSCNVFVLFLIAMGVCLKFVIEIGIIIMIAKEIASLSTCMLVRYLRLFK